jgi:hypothetical protein
MVEFLRGGDNRRMAALAGALFVYGAAGSPTPDNPGLAELLTGLLLLFAVGPGQIMRSIKGCLRHAEPFWHKAGRSLFLYGLSVPFAVAVLRGNDLGLVLRDVIPFLFMMMPLFLSGLIGRHRAGARLMIGAALWVGFAFALRSLFPGGTLDMAGMIERPVSGELLYLANAPTVLFAAVFAGATGFYAMTGRLRVTGIVLAVFMIALAAFPVLSMAAVFQRASMGYLLLAGMIVTGCVFFQRPARALVPLAAMAGAIIYLGPWIGELYEVLARKTLAVGMNNRLHEARAVLDALAGDFYTVVFGLGWGASYVSPAVGFTEVNFTHSLLTSLWLKTGLAGLALAGLYIGGIFIVMAAQFRRQPFLVLALAGPLLIAVLLYASYKSFDFGVLLLLAAALPSWPRTLQGGASCSKQKADRIHHHPCQETTGHGLKGA